MLLQDFGNRLEMILTLGIPPLNLRHFICDPCTIILIDMYANPLLRFHCYSKAEKYQSYWSNLLLSFIRCYEANKPCIEYGCFSMQNNVSSYH